MNKILALGLRGLAVPSPFLACSDATGSGTNFNQPVTWTLDVTDGGGGKGGDTFTFSTSDGCAASGPLVDGNVEYEISK